MKIKRLILENKFLVILFVLSTSFFVFQHYINLSWDFAAYVSNAKYFAGEGNYFELLRGPLMPAILIPLSVFGWTASEYIFIIMISLLFLYSSIKLSDAAKIDRNIFYLFSLSPFVLFFGFINGTEILSIALLELFIAFLLQGKSYTGIFIGLAFLARYTMIIFLPLVILSGGKKKILKSLACFFVISIPWLVYNFNKTSNMFSSFADSYALNVAFRQYIVQPVNYFDFFVVVSFFLPFFIIGLVKILRSWKINNIQAFIKKEKINIIFILIILFSIYQLYKTPIKEIRYLFTLAIPVAYFSTIGMDVIRNAYHRHFKLVLSILIILIIVHFSYINLSVQYSSGEAYAESISKINELNLSECKTLSNAWVPLSYLGKNTGPFPAKNLLKNSIDQGNFIILFYFIQEPSWVMNSTFLHEHQILYENNNFAILGNSSECNRNKQNDQTYLNMTWYKILSVKNKSININPCFVLFDSMQIMENGCNYINYGRFMTDSNRISGSGIVKMLE